MTSGGPLRIAIIAGEESGDLLGADLIMALKAATGRQVQLTGIGGRHLTDLGLKPLFDSADIALMGLSAVLRDLPRLLKRISQTARVIAEERPACLITIDSPDFTLRVAKKVRAANPSIPIIHYVCPSVWAWRPGRALAMKPYVDDILCLLPFEPAELQRLGGPPGSFVGHRLTDDPAVRLAALQQSRPRDLSDDRRKTLLLLPGSRRGEVSRLIGLFDETVSILLSRGHRLRLVLPTVPHVADLVRTSVQGWQQQPEIIADAAGKWQAFGDADAALIASGTVSLELALAGVPMVATYRTDPLMTIAGRWLISTWTALLPNLIADRSVVPEYFNEYIRPNLLARVVEALLTDSPPRAWQKDGFAEVKRRMATPRPSGEIAAEIVLKRIANGR